MVKVRGQTSNGKTVKQTAKKWHVRAFVTSVVTPRHHKRSPERFEMFMISRNQFVEATCCSKPNTRSNSRPFRSLEFLMPGTHTVTHYRTRFRHPRFFGHFRQSIWQYSCLNFDIGLWPWKPTRKKAYKIRAYDFGVQFSFILKFLRHCIR